MRRHVSTSSLADRSTVLTVLCPVFYIFLISLLHAVFPAVGTDTKERRDMRLNLCMISTYIRIQIPNPAFIHRRMFTLLPASRGLNVNYALTRRY
jgi:hypothetical protein